MLVWLMRALLLPAIAIGTYALYGALTEKFSNATDLMPVYALSAVTALAFTMSFADTRSVRGFGVVAGTVLSILSLVLLVYLVVYVGLFKEI